MTPAQGYSRDLDQLQKMELALLLQVIRTMATKPLAEVSRWKPSLAARA